MKFELDISGILGKTAIFFFGCQCSLKPRYLIVINDVCQVSLFPCKIHPHTKSVVQILLKLASKYLTPSLVLLGQSLVNQND